MSPKKLKRKHKLSLTNKYKSKRRKDSDHQSSDSETTQCSNNTDSKDTDSKDLFDEHQDVAVSAFYALQSNSTTKLSLPTRYCNVFATAELLEKAQSSQRLPNENNRRPPPMPSTSTGFVAFVDHFQPPADRYFQTQLPVSFTQLDRLCETANSKSGDSVLPSDVLHTTMSPIVEPPSTTHTPPPRRQPNAIRDAILRDFNCMSPPVAEQPYGQLTTPSAAQHTTMSPSTTHSPPSRQQANAIRDTILRDFDCMSPPVTEHPSGQLTTPSGIERKPTQATQSPTPELKRTDQMRTYVRRRTENVQSRVAPPNRQLFEWTDASTASSVSDHRMDFLSDNDENGLFETCRTESHRSESSSPEVPLNRSGSVQANLLNLSMYYLPAGPCSTKTTQTDPTKCTDMESEVNALFKQISWLRTCRKSESDCSDGESRSFLGFGESIHDLSVSAKESLEQDEELEDVNEKMNAPEENVDRLLLEDDDLFVDMDVPQKHTLSNSNGHRQVAISQRTCSSGSLHRNEVCGLTTARGVRIDAGMSAVALERARGIFADCEVDPNTTVQTESKHIVEPISIPTPKKFNCFSTARGGQITISAVAASRVTGLFEGIDEDDNDVLDVLADLENSTNRCEDVDFTKSLRKPDHPNGCGFSTGRGAVINVSNAALQMSRKLFHEIDDTNSLTSTVATGLGDIGVSVPKGNGSGFSTGRGAAINFSEAALHKSRKLFDDIDEQQDSALNQPSMTTSTSGFSTARGTTINVSVSALKKSRLLLDDIESNVVHLDTHATARSVGGSGFSTGRGATINVSNAALEKSRKLFEENDVQPDLKATNPVSSAVTAGIGENINVSSALHKTDQLFDNIGAPAAKHNGSGFSTGRGAAINFSDAALQMSRKLFDDMEAQPDSVMKKESSVVLDNIGAPAAKHNGSGFSTGRGAVINFSEAALKMSRKLFDDIDEQQESAMIRPHVPTSTTSINASISALKKSRQLLDDVETTAVLDEPTGHTAPKIIMSKTILERTSTIFQDDFDNATSPTLTSNSKRTACLNRTSTPLNDKTFAVALTHCNRMSVADRILPRTPFNNHCDPSAQDPKTPLNSRPMPGSFTQEITDSTKALIEDELFSRTTSRAAEEHSLFLRTDEDFSPTVRKSLTSARPTRLAARFEETEPPTVVQPPAISDIVRAARQLARQAQEEHIHLKPKAKACPGTLYVKKLVSHRKHWCDFVHNERPAAKRCTTPSMPFAAAAAHRFDMSADCLDAENTAGLQLDDDMCVHLDDENRIGIAELQRAFLASNAVDPRLVHPAWVAHHYALIVHKLAAMERAFVGLLGGGRTLCVQNVAAQLKLRYDVEIDRVQRSIVRQLCEGDAAPGRRMVLFMLRGWSASECDVSDGHYILRAQLDGELERLWRAGRLAVGDKVMVHGAELVGLDDGCSPLEIPAGVRLRLFANSTRRVRWHTRLGACSTVGPFRIALDSVLAGGGRIGRLRLRIVRVYAMLYVDKTKKEGTNTVLRSERVQQRHEASTARQSEDMEKLYSQVTREIDQQQPTGRKSIRLAAAAARSTARVSEVTDASQLFAMLRDAMDPQAIESELSESQKRDLIAYQSKQMEARNELINQRVRERLAQDTRHKTTGPGDDATARPAITPLLKLRVIDAGRRRSGDERPKTAMLSVWNPHEHLLDMLRENRIIDVCNASACGVRYGDLQLSAGRGTQFQAVRATTEHDTHGLERHVTPISDIYPVRPQSPFGPVFNEFDTVGIVVRISEPSARKFQSVYVAVPAAPPALLCINFWAGLHAFAYDDLVVVGRALAARDLQWRHIGSQSNIPCSFATEFTFLTGQPRQPALAAAFVQLMQSTDAHPNWSLDQFVTVCGQIIDASTSSKTATSSTSTVAKRRQHQTAKQSPQTPLRSSAAVNGRCATMMAKTPMEFSPGIGNPVAMVQKRIEQLAMAYGEPPPLSPMVMPTGLASNRSAGLFKRPRDES